RSSDAYAFGDAATSHYPDNADASLTTPTLEISAARNAKLAFYHRYQFETGFDAGVVEASADGGKTWTPLPPLADELNGLPSGYVEDVPLAASNPLHTTGNPEDVQHAFSGDSSTLPASLDGWVLSQYDLSRFANITQKKAAFEFYRYPELGGFTGKGNNTTLTTSRVNPAIFTNSSWLVAGTPEEMRYWEYQSLTEPAGPMGAEIGSRAILSPIGSKTFWWSGSASYDD